MQEEGGEVQRHPIFHLPPLVPVPEVFWEMLVWAVGRGKRNVSSHGKENNSRLHPTKRAVTGEDRAATSPLLPEQGSHVCI